MISGWGEWWIFGEPQVRVQGDLSVAESGKASLELRGALLDLTRARTVSLCGEVNLGGTWTNATLVNAFPTRMSGVGTRVAQVAEATVTLLGTTNPASESTKFEIHLRHLYSWLSRTGFTVDLDEIAEILKSGYGVEWVPFESPLFPFREASLRFRIRPKTVPLFALGPRLDLGEVACISIELPSPLRFEKVLEEYVDPLSDLVSFGTGKDAALLHLSGVDTASASQITCLVEQGGGSDSERTLHPLHQLFTYDGMGDPGRIFQEWAVLHSNNRASLSLFFSLYRRVVSIEARLITLAQVIEALHRNIFRSTLSTTKGTAHIRRLLENTPPEDHKWIKETFGWIKSPRLAERIEDVVRRLGFAAEQLKVADVPQFAAEVSRRRNDVVHVNRTLENPDYVHLVNDAERIAYLVRALLLQAAGFDADARAAALAREAGRLQLVQARK